METLIKDTLKVAPKYDNSIIGITASVLNHFGTAPQHETCPALDELLKGDYRNIVLLVLDGLGSENLRDLLGNDCFLSRHKIADLSSVFPTTTAAAIPSIETGLTPLEHGWLGWEMYFPKEDENLVLFHNKQTVLKYFPLSYPLKKMKGVHYYELSPFVEDGEYRSEQLKDIADKLPGLCEKRGNKFIYAYSNQPDNTFHGYGNYAAETRKMVENINNLLERLRRDLNDALFIITAGHGHIDTPNWIDTNKIEGLSETLRVPYPSLEPRAAMFFVKEGKEAEFVDIMTNVVGDKGVILTRAEAEPLFGTGKKNKRFDEMMGDYLIVMTGDTNLWHLESRLQLKSMHAGLTSRELMVPLITIACPKVKKRLKQ